jgi:proteasome accessory factor C
LIPYLSRNPGLSIAQIAEAFNATPAEISAELETIFMCGLPGYTHLELIDLSLDTDYVEVIDPQNLGTPRTLTAREKVTLQLGLQMLLDIAPSKDSVSVIEGILRKISVDITIPSNVNQLEKPSISLADIQKAIESSSLVNFTYITDVKSTEREIFPLSVSVVDNRWLVQGYDYSSSQVKHFRADRMHNLEIGKVVDRPRYSNTPQLQIEVVMTKRAQYFLDQHASIVLDVRESNLDDSQLKVIFGSENPEWLIKALSTIPGYVEVTSPVGTARAFKEYSAELLSNYDKVSLEN